MEIIFYLEMLNPAHLRPAKPEPAGWTLARAPQSPGINRQFYQTVGADWHWTDRSAWTLDRWAEYVDRPELETWIGRLDGEPAGYFELEQQGAAGVEIAYFGLLPAFVGRGLGGVMLTEAVRRAWQLTSTRVWVHTCTLDHPQALANYLARGFTLYDEREG